MGNWDNLVTLIWLVGSLVSVWYWFKETIDLPGKEYFKTVLLAISFVGSCAFFGTLGELLFKVIKG